MLTKVDYTIPPPLHHKNNPQCFLFNMEHDMLTMMKYEDLTSYAYLLSFVTSFKIHYFTACNKLFFICIEHTIVIMFIIYLYLHVEKNINLRLFFFFNTLNIILKVLNKVNIYEHFLHDILRRFNILLYTKYLGTCTT